MTVKLINNAKTTLAEALSVSATSMTVRDVTVFPTLGMGDYYYVTLQRRDGVSEIVRVTGAVGAVLTVVRGVDGASPAAFSAGDLAEMRVTAASVVDAAQDAADAVTLTQFGVTATAGDINDAATKVRDTVAALLADTVFTYTAGQPGTVAAGNYIRTRAEGFSYRVAASGATDQHITTAGGVKLYVLPGGEGYNVKAFGAAGDGVEDDTAAVQVALGSDGAILDGGGSTYRVTGSLIFQVGKVRHLRNCVFDFSGAAADDELFRAVSSYGSEVDLTADATYGDTDISVTSTTGISAGDEIFISSDGVWSNDGSETVTKGETITIAEVVSGISLRLKFPVDDTYLVSDAGKIQRLAGHTRIKLENIRAIGAGGSNTQVAGVFARVRGLEIIGCEFEGFDLSGPYIQGCTDVIVQGRVIGTEEASQGYAVAILGPNRNVLISNCHFSDGRTGGTQGGTSGAGRNIVFNACTFTGYGTAAANTKGGAASIVVSNCVAVGSNGATGLGDGFRIRGRDVVLTGNIARGFKRYPYLVTLNGVKGGRAATAVIANNLAEMARDIAFYVSVEGASDAEGVSIVGNTATFADDVATASNGGIHVRAENSRSMKSLLIANNNLPQCPFNGIDVRTSDGGLIDGLRQADNIVSLTTAATSAGRRKSVVSGMITNATVTDGDGDLIYDPSAHSWTVQIERAARYVIDDTGLRPSQSAARDLGGVSYRWSNVYGAQFRPGAGTVIITSGAGSPEGVLTAPVGSLYCRTDGGAGTSIYVKESGTGNTGWVAK